MQHIVHTRRHCFIMTLNDLKNKSLIIIISSMHQTIMTPPSNMRLILHKQTKQLQLAKAWTLQVP